MEWMLVSVFLSSLIVALAKDYCIIGAGPSGLQMGHFMEKAGFDYMIYERDSSPGWFYKVYPRHRQLISINKRHTGKQNKEFNMRHDWNSLLSDDDSLLFKHYSKEFFPPADVLVQYLADFAERLHLKVQYNTYIAKVSRNGTEYVLRDKNGTNYQCKYLIVSTGAWVENVPHNVTGMEYTEGYPQMSVNPDDYEGQNVLVLGRGNSGFETAQHIMGATNVIHMLSRTRVKFSWETHYVGDVRAVNDGPIDTYQLKSLDGQLEGDLKTIRFVRHNNKTYMQFKDDSSVSDPSMPSATADNVAIRLGYDRILRCTGFKFDRTIFDKNTRPGIYKQAKKFPEISPMYESTKSPGMYFTGVITHSLDFRKSAGGFIHGYRYTTRSLFRLLSWKNHGIAWPTIRLPTSELMNHLLRRINEASGIYQMFSCLVDVIVFRENNTFEYYEEFPLDLVHEFGERSGHPFTRGIVINFEYGKNFSGPGSDPFKEDRATGDAQEAHTSNFLHPVLYYYKSQPMKGKEKLTLPKPDRLHHMVEDFLTEWAAPVSHILPLRWFLEHCTGEDLRRFYAESCFESAMTGTSLPYSCDNEYMKGMGLLRPVAPKELVAENLIKQNSFA